MKADYPNLRRCAAAVALSILVANAVAVGLGDAEIQSSLGMPLHVEIPLHMRGDEAVDDQCLTLVAAPGGLAEANQGLGLQMRILRSNPPRVLVQSVRPITEPFVSLRLRLECGGAGLVRDYTVLVDPQMGSVNPPEVERPAAKAEPQVSTTSSQRDAAHKKGSSAGQPARRARATAHHPSKTASGAVTDIAAAYSRLRLSSGLLGNAQSTGAQGGRPVEGGGGGFGTLRLETHFDVPAAVTTSLVAERGHLRELRTLLLSGDDTLDRVLTLQGQVGALEAQLHSLQSGNASTGAGSAGAAATAAAPAANPTTSPAPSPAASGTQPSSNAVPSDVAGNAQGGPISTAPRTPSHAIVAASLPKLQDAQSGLVDVLSDTLPFLAAGLLTLAGLVFIFLRRRRARKVTGDEFLFGDADSILAEAARHRSQAVDRETVRTESPLSEPPVATVQAPASVPETEADARTAYLHERFPEIAAGLIKLDDAESVVNGAHLYTDHGDYDLAEELLEAALQGRTASDVRPWLALFELHRMREEVSPYASLLGRFRERFGDSRYLPEVLAVGRQLDASHPDFAVPEGANPDAASSDPTGWLSAELDFVPESLARDLHETLMAELDEPVDPPEAKVQGSSS